MDDIKNNCQTCDGTGWIATDETADVILDTVPKEKGSFRFGIEGKTINSRIQLDTEHAKWLIWQLQYWLEEGEFIGNDEGKAI